MCLKAPPLQQIGLYFCAFHNYASEPHRHILAHHFCSHVSAEMHQCIIYDSNQPNARLMGIESEDRDECRRRRADGWAGVIRACLYSSLRRDHCSACPCMLLQVPHQRAHVQHSARGGEKVLALAPV